MCHDARFILLCGGGLALWGRRAAKAIVTYIEIALFAATEPIEMRLKAYKSLLNTVTNAPGFVLGRDNFPGKENLKPESNGIYKIRLI